MSQLYTDSNALADPDNYGEPVQHVPRGNPSAAITGYGTISRKPTTDARIAKLIGEGNAVIFLPLATFTNTPQAGDAIYYYLKYNDPTTNALRYIQEIVGQDQLGWTVRVG